MAKAIKISKKKASKAVKDTADFATDNWQPLLILLGIGVGLYAVTKIVGTVSDGFNLGDAPGAGGGTINPYGGNTIPSGATITANQAQFIAAGLKQAMANGWGTDEDAIFNLLRGKNVKDFALISTAFGSPRYDGNGEAFFPFPATNLSNWLTSELNDNEINQLKLIMPGVLA